MKALLLALGVALATPFVACAETPCADLAQTRLPHATVTSATEVEAGGKAACRVLVTSRPTADSDIKIEVVIPRGSAWNGKYVQVGNGGLAGSIPSAQILARAEAGYAAAGTDDGHAGTRTAVWALHHPEKVVDFGSRSLKETTDAAKAVIAAQKGEPPKRSYFIGCSAGGREALIEAQRFPRDFDGIVAGAPMNYYTLSYAGRAYMQQALARPGAYLGLEQLQLLQQAALKQCAGGAPFIRDQLACRFDPAVLRCRSGQASGCLTGPQIASARAIYGGRVVGGRSVFPGYEPGAEAIQGGWQAWNTGESQATWTQSSGHAMGSQVMKYIFHDDPAFDFLKMDLGAGFEPDRRRVARVLDAVDPDLTAFAGHGGKLVQYHGWNDPAIAPRGSIRYHDAVAATNPDAARFYRLYMIPGMLHCRGGPGPSGVDWLSLLDDWVVDGKPPGEITATSEDRPETQRLCPYPGVARETAGGSWSCRAGGARPAR